MEWLLLNGSEKDGFPIIREDCTRLSSYGTCPKVMRRHIAEERRFTHLPANRLIGIRHTTGYSMTSIWYDFKTGKPQYSFDPPKSRYIPPAFLQQVVSSGKPTSTSSPQSESSDFRMSHVSLNNAPNDEVCIVHGEPVSGDFKQFLENHPDMDFYDAKRKFKEEQKAKQRVRQGPKLP